MSAVKERQIALLQDTEFDSAKWLSDEIKKRGIVEGKESASRTKKETFKNICKTARKELSDLIDSEENKDAEWLDRQHKAVIGDTEAVEYFITKIKEVLRTNNMISNDYPNFYESLAEAVFHEIWGVSILKKWDLYPRSEAAVIRGTELWIDINGEFVKQRELFNSPEQVERIKRSFLMRIENSVLNKQQPDIEIEREDGSRITMMQKPRSRENYVMFRRFVVKNLSLDEQARLDTIPEKDVPIYKALSRTMANTLVVGRVRSAKSTFLKSFVRERDPKYTIAVMEKHFELHLKEHMPNRLIYETQAKEGDLHEAFPRLLRMEHDFVIVGEIRSKEAEGFIQSMERGERGALSTYHVTDVHNIVPQLARHLLDEYPNRTPEIELERVARALDLVITMTSERDRRKKRVLAVTEVIWDEERREYKTKDLIRFSPVTKKYYYSADISKRLLRLMAEENLEETKNLVKYLKEREAKSPMSNYENMTELEAEFNV